MKSFSATGGTTAFWDAATFHLIADQSPAPQLRRVLLEVLRTCVTEAPHLKNPHHHQE